MNNAQTAPKRRFIGQADGIAILRGQVEINPGDTFISESCDKKGFAAFQYTPTADGRGRPSDNFRFLVHGTKETCAKVARAETE